MITRKARTQERIDEAIKKSCARFQAEAKIYGLTPAETEHRAGQLKIVAINVPKDDLDAPCVVVYDRDARTLILDPWMVGYAAFIKNGIDVGFSYAAKRGVTRHKGDREECTNDVCSGIWEWASTGELFTLPAPPRRPHGTSITKGIRLADVRPCTCTGGRCRCPEDQPWSRQKWFFKIATSRATSYIRPIEQRDQRASQAKHKDVAERAAQGLPPLEEETFPQYIRLGYKAKRTLEPVLALNAQVDDVVDGSVDPDARNTVYGMTNYGKAPRRKKLPTALSARSGMVYVPPAQLDPNVLAHKWPAATLDAVQVGVKGPDRTTPPPITFGKMSYVMGPIPQPQANSGGDGWSLRAAPEGRTLHGFTPTCYGCHPTCKCRKRNAKATGPEEIPEEITDPEFSWETPEDDSPDKFFDGGFGNQEDTAEDDNVDLSDFTVFSDFDTYSESLQTVPS
jgi:hypothetical protein